MIPSSDTESSQRVKLSACAVINTPSPNTGLSLPLVAGQAEVPRQRAPTEPSIVERFDQIRGLQTEVSHVKG